MSNISSKCIIESIVTVNGSNISYTTKVRHVVFNSRVFYLVGRRVSSPNKVI